jgi:hypothetical protein
VFQIIPLDRRQKVQEVILRANPKINYVSCRWNWPVMKKLRDVWERDH